MGLKRIAKALSSLPLWVKSYRGEDKLVFWYATATTNQKAPARL